MWHRSGTLLGCHHSEMLLMPIEPGEEDDASFVVEGGRLKCREWHGRRKEIVIPLPGNIARIQGVEGGGCHWRNSVEDAQDFRVAVPLASP